MMRLPPSQNVQLMFPAQFSFDEMVNEWVTANPQCYLA